MLISIKCVCSVIISIVEEHSIAVCPRTLVKPILYVCFGTKSVGECDLNEKGKYDKNEEWHMLKNKRMNRVACFLVMPYHAMLWRPFHVKYIR